MHTSPESSLLVVSPSGGTAKQSQSSVVGKQKIHFMGTGLYRWIAILILLSLCFLSLNLLSCRTAPWEGFPTATKPELTWPSPPAQGRLAFVMEIKNQQDLFKSAGFWKSVGEIVGGPKDSSMVRPYAIALHPQGGLLVADPGRQMIHFYNWSKRQYISVGPKRKGGLISPVGVAALSDGAILVSDSYLQLVERFDSEGKDLGPFLSKDKVGRPAGIAISPSGEVFIADVINHRIIVCNTQGQILRTFGKRGDKPGEFNFPTHVAIEPDGKLCVSDSLNFRVQILNADGSPIRTIGRLGDAPGQFSKPKGVTIDPHGNVIVVEGLYDALNFFDPQANLLLTVGSPGGSPGQFWLPAGLAFDPAQNLLFVADSYNRRLQVFRVLDEKNGKQVSYNDAPAK